MDTRPIGIIDSGSGGLSIWKAVVDLLPQESIIYIGDHAYLPYSDKTMDGIRSRVRALIQDLVRRDCKLCVVACNTATVAGIGWYREQFPNLPIVGVVPVIKTAGALTKTGYICILSTVYTAKSAYQKKLIREFAPDKHVFSLGSVRLTPLIESEKDVSNDIQKELISMVKPVLRKPIDVVVLGCTHYPFIRDVVSMLFGKHVAVIDSGDAVARQVMRILTQNNAISTGSPEYSFFTSGEPRHVGVVMSRLLGRHIVVEHMSIP